MASDTKAAALIPFAKVKKAADVGPISEQALVDGRLDINTLTRDQLIAELQRRALDTNGTKQQLRNRFLDYIMEKMRWRTKKLAVDAATKQAEADLEQRGSVYAAGLNALGTDATCAVYTLVPEFRGSCVVHLTAADDYCLAVTENKAVYAFGRPTAPIFEVSATDAAKLTSATSTALLTSSKAAFNYSTAKHVGTLVAAARGEGVAPGMRTQANVAAAHLDSGEAQELDDVEIVGLLDNGGSMMESSVVLRADSASITGSALSLQKTFIDGGGSLGGHSIQPGALNRVGDAAYMPPGAAGGAGTDPFASVVGGGSHYALPAGQMMSPDSLKQTRRGGNRGALDRARMLDASVFELGKPKAVPGLDGERVIWANAGCGYAAALSDGGDCYILGSGPLGHASLTTDPHLVRRHVAAHISFLSDTPVADACFGHGFAALLDAETGSVLVWGNNSRGYLGLEEPPRYGVGDADSSAIVSSGSTSVYARRGSNGGGGGGSGSFASSSSSLGSPTAGAGGGGGFSSSSSPGGKPFPTHAAGTTVGGDSSRHFAGTFSGSFHDSLLSPSQGTAASVASGKQQLPPLLADVSASIGQTSQFFKDDRVAPPVYGFSTSTDALTSVGLNSSSGGGGHGASLVSIGSGGGGGLMRRNSNAGATAPLPFLRASSLMGPGLTPGGAALQVYTPTLVRSLAGNGIVIRQISCGGHHVIALADPTSSSASAGGGRKTRTSTDMDGDQRQGAPSEDAYGLTSFCPVYTWGAGDGYRLGHGDLKDRFFPCPVENLKGQTVYQVAASETASYAVVKRRGVMAILLKAGMELPMPPLSKSSSGDHDHDVTPATKSALGGGNKRRNIGKASRRGVSFGDTTVYEVDDEEDAAAATAAASARNAARVLSQYRGNSLVVWGTGTYGQLGLGPAVTEARTPTMVPAFEEEQVSVRYVACSSTHAAAIAGRNSNLYVWGHNRFHSLGLGPDMESVAVVYAPAKVLQFNTIVDGIGRGKPRSVACGRYFTVVSTHAYTGIDVAEALAAGAKKALVEDDKARATELEMRRKMALEKAAEEDRLRKQAAANELSFAAPPPCTLCTACTGFQPDPFAPALCRFCTHLRSRHNTASDLRKHALLGGSGPRKATTTAADDDEDDDDDDDDSPGKPKEVEKRKSLFFY